MTDRDLATRARMTEKFMHRAVSCEVGKPEVCREACELAAQTRHARGAARRRLGRSARISDATVGG